MASWIVAAAAQTPPSLLLLAAALHPERASLFGRNATAIVPGINVRLNGRQGIITHRKQSSSTLPTARASPHNQPPVTVPLERVGVEPITPRLDGCRRRLHRVPHTPPSGLESLVADRGSSEISEENTSTRSLTDSSQGSESSGRSGSSAGAFPVVVGLFPASGGAPVGLFPADEWDLYEAATTGAQVRVVGPATMVTRGVTPSSIIPSAALVTWHSQAKVTEAGEALNHGSAIEWKHDSAGGTWRKGRGLYDQTPGIKQTHGDGCDASSAVAFPLTNKLPVLGKLLLQCGTARHVVRRGEWGAMIARRYGVSLTDLSRANPGLRLGKLVPGQAINLPATAKPLANPTMAFCAVVQWMLRAIAAVRELVLRLFQWLQQQLLQQQHQQHYQQWPFLGKFQELQRWSHQQQQQLLYPRQREDEATQDDENDSMEDGEEEALNEWVETDTDENDSRFATSEEGLENQIKTSARVAVEDLALQPFASRTQLLMQRWMGETPVQQWVQSVSVSSASSKTPSLSLQRMELPASLHVFLLLSAVILVMNISAAGVCRQDQAVNGDSEAR